MKGDITINVTNNSGKRQTGVTLLAGLQNILPGSPVSISMSGLNYQSLLREITGSTHCIEGIGFRASSDAQMENAWTLRSADSSGHMQSEVFTPVSYTSSSNVQARIIDFIPVNFALDGKNSITLSMEPHERVTFILLKCRPKSKFANFMWRVLTSRKRKSLAFCAAR